LSKDWTTGYCTNVHAGTNLDQIRTNLAEIACSVREQLDCPSMGVGLWIPAEASQELLLGEAAYEFGDWLSQRDLLPFTINGFPYGNFHQPVVKHRVYEPRWWDDARRQYTLDLATILHRILPAGLTGSISTLPLGWGRPSPSGEQLDRAAANLKFIATELARLENDTGRQILIAIEPEPGCVIDTTDDMIGFFDRYLPNEADRRYLTVCHDICHAAVMSEPQREVLMRYADAGIGVGKVQVSSAIEVRWDDLDGEARQRALAQLREFAEDRYLHQTMVVSRGGSQRLVEDLPELVTNAIPTLNDQVWKIHFHVPIYLDTFGELHATRADVQTCLQSLASVEGLQFSGHLEAETYAWGVLPDAISVDNLAEGIAAELRWLADQVQN